MKKFLLISMLVMGLILPTGCSKAGETLAQLKNDLRQEVNAPTPKQEEFLTKTEEIPEPEIPDLDDLTIEETYEPVQTSGSLQSGGAGIEVSLYFTDADGENLVEKKTKIPKVEGLARATIETLLTGPDKDSELKSAIPQGTELLDINIRAEEKLCIVDFSSELLDSLEDSGVSEKIVFESITKTLCQFPSIEKVEFRVEGQPLSRVS